MTEPIAILPRLRRRLATIEDWTEPTIEKEMRAFAAEIGASFGHCARLCRVGITGRSVGLPITLELVLFGKDGSLARLDNVLVRQYGEWILPEWCPPPEQIAALTDEEVELLKEIRDVIASGPDF